MNAEWTKADGLLRCVTVTGSDRNEVVDVSNVPESLSCIGIGTDAAVFIHHSLPGYAYKVYSELAVQKKETERLVYERLAGIRYFPSYYGTGPNYLVISHEPGPTLLECLIEGIPVPEQVILDVEEARALARSRGLNPRDIHLRNVVVQDGRAKLLDVSEYLLDGNDERWEHLVWAYRMIYPHLEGKKIPAWVLNRVKESYLKRYQANSGMDDFAKYMTRLFAKFLK